MDIPRVASQNVRDPYNKDVNKIYLASGELSEHALIDTGTGIVGAIVVTTDGTNDAECVVYDAVTGTGKIGARIPVKGSDAIGGQVIPFRVDNGIYATITGTGAKYQIYYL